MKYVRKEVDEGAVQQIWELVKADEGGVSFDQFIAASRLISWYQQKESSTAIKTEVPAQLITSTGHSVDFAEPSAPRLSLIEDTLQVKVLRPTLVSSGLFGVKSFIMYNIEVRQTREVWTVDRRFSDFDWLNTQLGLLYKGLMIPSLPQKRTLRNTDQSFVEERTAQLDSYLSHIASHPVLHNSDAFTCFIHGPRTEFRAVRKHFTVNWLELPSLEDMVESTLVWRSKSMSRNVSDIELSLNRLASAQEQWGRAYRSYRSVVSERAQPNALLAMLGDQLCNRLSAFSANTITDTSTAWRVLSGELMRTGALKNAIASYKSELLNYAKQEARLKQQHDKLNSLKLTLYQLEQQLVGESRRYDEMRVESMKALLRQLAETKWRESLEGRGLWITD
jgi:hypothetical protein